MSFVRELISPKFLKPNIHLSNGTKKKTYLKYELMQKTFKYLLAHILDSAYLSGFVFHSFLFIRF